MAHSTDQLTLGHFFEDSLATMRAHHTDVPQLDSANVIEIHAEREEQLPAVNA